jgi:GT2 family glycosyltransferase
MNKTITLVVFNESSNIDWSLGGKYSLEYTTKSLNNKREELLKENSDYILFWDAKNKLPSKEVLEKVYNSKGNLWHIGTKIGLNNSFDLLEDIQPTSMLHVSINDKINHSSWKKTFKGCLLEKRVFEEIDLANYSNCLDIIGLDFGYRAMKSGVFTRYSSLLSEEIASVSIKLSKIDELLFIRNNFDAKAFIWCYITNFFSISPFSFLKASRRKRKIQFNVFSHRVSNNILENKDTSVAIVIATLDRYSFLKDELKEIGLLKHLPKEIIIIDQTVKERRDKTFLKAFSDLPIKYIEADKIGQCTARNKGIEVAKSKFIWFLDDDMKDIPSDYLSRHLETLYGLNVDVSCGIPDELGTDFIDRSLPKIEISDGLPVGDTLIKKSLLDKVEGFDIKMDQLQSEDQEMGLRLLKKGALIIKNNQLRIVHLRAPRGGLRNHNVRKVTFASSRKSIWVRRFLHYSEIYLCLKHFSKKQIHKSLLLNIRGTFIIRGSILKKLMKFLFAILVLPQTLYITSKNLKIAKKLLAK